MKHIFWTASLVLYLSAIGHAQTAKVTNLEQYLDSAKTMIIGRCVDVGPVNILGRSAVTIDVLYVVKGRKMPQRITVDSQYGMDVGTTYLIRSEDDIPADHHRLRINTRASVIPVRDDIEELKKLSPRIIVLRTMNLRVYQLESEIRGLTYELESLNAARSE